MTRDYEQTINSIIIPADQSYDYVFHLGSYEIGLRVHITNGESKFQIIPEDASEHIEYLVKKPKKIIIGRFCNGEGTIQISNDTISKEHLQLTLFPNGQVTAVDLKSTNGTHILRFNDRQKFQGNFTIVRKENLMSRPKKILGLIKQPPHNFEPTVIVGFNRQAKLCYTKPNGERFETTWSRDNNPLKISETHTIDVDLDEYRLIINEI
jgi:hypothetical protein